MSSPPVGRIRIPDLRPGRAAAVEVRDHGGMNTSLPHRLTDLDAAVETLLATVQGPLKVVV